MKGCVRGLIVACFISAIAAMPSDPSEARNSVHDNIMEQVLADCSKKDSVSCFKYKLFSYVDKAINSRDSFSIAEGVNVVKTESAEGSPRALDEKSDDVETMFVNRFERFMQTHTFKFDIKGADVLRAVSNAANTLGLLPNSEMEEARGKKKKAIKLLLPLLLAMKLKVAALIPLAIGAIALIAGKALVTAKIALLISLIMALKKLMQNQQMKNVTYEVISHPINSHHDVWPGDNGYGGSGNGGGGGGGGGGGHGGGWGRSTNDAHHLAYKAYQPQH